MSNPTNQPTSDTPSGPFNKDLSSETEMELDQYTSANEDVTKADNGLANITEQEQTTAENPAKDVSIDADASDSNISPAIHSAGQSNVSSSNSSSIFKNLVFLIDTGLPHDVFKSLSKKITKNGGEIMDDDESDTEDTSNANSTGLPKSTFLKFNLNNIIKVTMEGLPATSLPTTKHSVSPDFITQSLSAGKLLSFDDFSVNTKKELGNKRTVSQVDGQQNEQNDTSEDISNGAETPYMFMDVANNITNNVSPIISSQGTPPSAQEAVKQPKQKRTKTNVYEMALPKVNFTPEEDELILAYVRKNPKMRETHSLYHRIAQVLGNHTGNSVRFRFRNTLFKKLEYVYKVDDNGELVRDEEGQLIKTSTLPKKLKNNYTAEEDYVLCIAVKKQFFSDIYHVDPEEYEQSQLEKQQQEKNQAESEKDSDQLGSSTQNNSETIDSANSLLPTISTNGTTATSEADYLNHILNHQQLTNVPSFSEFKVGHRRGPLTRAFFKNFQVNYPSHTESSWRDRFRKFSLVYGIDKYIDYYEGCLKENVEPEPMKNLTTRHSYETQSTVDESLASGAPQSQFAISGPGNFSRQFTAALSLATGEAVSDLFDSASPAALINVAANAVNAVDNVQNLIPTTDDNEQEEQQQQQPEDNDEIIASQAVAHAQSQPADKVDNSNIFDMFSNSELSMEYIEKSKNIKPSEKLLTYFNIDLGQFDNDLSKFLFIVSSCVVECLGDPIEVVVQNLEKETGVSAINLLKILFSCSNEVSELTKYFFYAFKQNDEEPKNVEGIFHPEDDAYLAQDIEQDSSPEYQNLLSTHGSDIVAKRKQFLSKAQPKMI